MRLIYLILFILFSLHGFSQSYYLNGNISTNDPNDIILGDVFLTSKDNIVIKSSMIEEGVFRLDSITAGDYLLVVTCLGFEKKSEPISINKNQTINILLQERLINLNEVVVLGKKQLFLNKHGNIKINLDNPYFYAFPDVVSLLGKMPGVQVNPDQESINVIGKGAPLIYLENQKITINELKSLSVEEIGSIDILNNPSSKYEADGQSVILLTRKKRKQEGHKVSITERITKKRYFSNNLDANLNILKNKFEFKANFAYNQLKIWEKNGFDFNIKEENIQSNYMTKAITTRPQFKMSIGSYYQITENQYISIDMNGRPLYETYPISTKTFINNQGQKDNILTENKSKNHGLFYSGNLNYERKMHGLNAKLFVGAQYSLFDKNIQSDIYDSYQEASQTFNRHREQKYKVNAYAFKTDYEQKFKNDMVWEIGAKLSLSDAYTRMKTTSGEIAEANDLSSYKYNEYIYAAYTQLSGKISRLSYSGGVRAEYTAVRKDFSIAKENYTKFFPKLSVGIPIDSTKSLNLSYSRSITRPNYSSSSQLEVYINPFYAISGNINLKPSTIDEVSLNMQYKQISLGLSYYQKQNPIYRKTEYNNDRKLLSLIYANFQKEEGFNISLNAPFTYKSVSSTNSLIMIYNKVKDKSAQYLDTKPYLYYYSTNQFTFPGAYVFTLSAWGLTKRKEGIFDRNAFVVVDLSLSKTFFKKLDCNLLFSDIFKTMKFNERFFLNNIESKGTFYTDTHSITLTLKYTFGKEKVSKYKNKSIEDNLYRMK